MKYKEQPMNSFLKEFPWLIKETHEMIFSLYEFELNQSRKAIANKNSASVSPNEFLTNSKKYHFFNVSFKVI
jgi:hypothetical protein